MKIRNRNQSHRLAITQPNCLAGRATAVLGSSNIETPHKSLPANFSFPEIARENEGKIIEELRQEIEKDERRNIY